MNNLDAHLLISRRESSILYPEKGKSCSMVTEMALSSRNLKPLGTLILYKFSCSSLSTSRQIHPVFLLEHCRRLQTVLLLLLLQFKILIMIFTMSLKMIFFNFKWYFPKVAWCSKYLIHLYFYDLSCLLWMSILKLCFPGVSAYRNIKTSKMKLLWLVFLTISDTQTIQ